MENKDWDKIQGCYVKLVNSLDVSDLLDHLVENFIFTIDDSERVERRETSKDKAKQLLALLRRKPGAFKPFCDCLHKTGQSHLVAAIGETKARPQPVSGGGQEKGSASSASFIPDSADLDISRDFCGKMSLKSKEKIAPQTRPAPRTREGASKPISVKSNERPEPQTRPAPRKEKIAPKTLPVQSPSPASGAAQKVVGGLRRTTSVSVPGGWSVWGGGLCVVDDDTAWVGGVNVVTQVRVTGGQTVSVCKTVRVCDGKSGVN
ncbi:hypothetical protein ScPMuIL_012436 [Solemya velum]